MNWIDKLERKYGKYAISGLMKYITIITAAVFLMRMFDTSGVFYSKIILDPAKVAQGQVWRLFTYIFIPPSTSAIWSLFALYFYYMIGTNLEREWGSFRFNLYYLIGMIGTTIAVYIAGGHGTSTYLNLSLFLAFAYIYPDFEVLIYFILPVKMKYLGWINWIFIGFTVITNPNLVDKIAALASVLNFFVFFGPGMLKGGNRKRQTYSRRRDFNTSKKAASVGLVQKCEICGVTHAENPNMEFRYCSKCEGRHCYCMDHIKDHEHIVTASEDKIIEFPGNKKEE
jgi:membrane associated rhomboid family serine protease